MEILIKHSDCLYCFVSWFTFCITVVVSSCTNTSSLSSFLGLSFPISHHYEMEVENNDRRKQWQKWNWSCCFSMMYGYRFGKFLVYHGH